MTEYDKIVLSMAPCDEGLLKEALDELLEKCTEREADILRLRYGLADEKARSLEETAQVFGISRERVRQIESKALHRHSRLTPRKKIADYYK